jgi:hypothetical protein
MGRPKKEMQFEKREIHKTINFTVREKEMLDEILGGKKEYSEYLGKLILEDYEEKFSQAEDEVINVDEIVKKYKDRRNTIVVFSKEDYKVKSKKYIEGNNKIIKKAFPGLTIDEIYIKLEELIKGA